MRTRLLALVERPYRVLHSQRPVETTGAVKANCPHSPTGKRLA